MPLSMGLQTGAEKRRQSLEADNRKARRQAAALLRVANGGSVGAISRATGVPKSTVYKLKALVDQKDDERLAKITSPSKRRRGQWRVPTDKEEKMIVEHIIRSALHGF